MANDTPFVDLTNRSPVQGTADRLVRGDDYATPISVDGYDANYGDTYGSTAYDDEYLKAIAYGLHIKLQAKVRLQLLAKLKGSTAARNSIQAKTQALARNAVPHVLDPAGSDPPVQKSTRALV